MAASDDRVPPKIGPWHLREKIGSGGNAEVWRAEAANGNFFALKILKQRRLESEPYQRFRDEIAILRKLNNPPGLLPLIDSHLPVKPSRQEPAWLAMPIATPIRKFLGIAPPLRDVVEAIATIASTLAGLAENHLVFHRDLKPENLYHFASSWCIGDFGLVDYPEKQSLTAPGRWIGPIHYLAPELLMAPDIAESGPADVYALAKTLWVLAAGQNYPLPGFLNRQIPQFCLSSYNPDDRATLLDQLVERGTQHNPEDRPSMRECAEELMAWLAYPYPEGSPRNLDLTRERVRPLFQNRLHARTLHHELEEHARGLLHVSLEKLKPIGKLIEQLTGLKSDSAINLAVGRPEEFDTLGETGSSYGAALVAARCPSSTSSRKESMLVAGISISHNLPPEIRIGGAFWLVTSNGHRKTLWHVIQQVHSGTARESLALADIIQDLTRELPRAVQQFADEVNLEAQLE